MPESAPAPADDGDGGGPDLDGGGDRQPDSVVDQVPVSGGTARGGHDRFPESSRRGALIGAAVVVGALVVWVLVTGLFAAKSALAMRSDADDFAAALRAGDSPGVTESLSRLRSDAETADARLNGPPWSQIATLPVVGPPVANLADVAAGTAGVAGATRGREREIAAVAHELKAGGLRAVGNLTRLRDITAAAAEAVRLPAARLRARDDGLVGPVGDVRSKFLDVSDAVVAADAGVNVLPELLGARGSQQWLVLFQNLSEPRSTGGLVSAYVPVHVNHGRFRAGSATTTNDIARDEASLAGIPRDTIELWGAGDLARSYGWNLDRHFPYAARIALQSVANTVGAQAVVSLDAEAVAALLQITGPVSAAGVTVDAATAVEFFTRGIYAEFPDQLRKDEVTVQLIDAVVKRFFNGQLDVGKLVSAVAGPARDGHLLVYSGSEQTQRWLEKTPVAGAVPQQPGAWAAVAVNDNSGDKMAPYLHTTVTWESAARCEEPTALSRLRVTIRNDAPRKLPRYVDLGARTRGGAPSSTTMGVAVYGPVGSAIRTAMLDDQPTPVVTGTDRGHPVWRVGMPLVRGQERSFLVEFAEPKSPSAVPQLTRQPMVNPQTTDVLVVGC